MLRFGLRLVRRLAPGPGEPPAPECGGAAGGRAPGQEGRRDRQADRLERGHGQCAGRDPDLRRLRVHERVPGRPVLPGREDPGDRRGHLGGPANDHRPRAGPTRLGRQAAAGRRSPAAPGSRRGAGAAWSNGRSDADGAAQASRNTGLSGTQASAEHRPQRNSSGAMEKLGPTRPSVCIRLTTLLRCVSFSAVGNWPRFTTAD